MIATKKFVYKENELNNRQYKLNPGLHPGFSFVNVDVELIFQKLHSVKNNITAGNIIETRVSSKAPTAAILFCFFQQYFAKLNE